MDIKLFKAIINSYISEYNSAQSFDTKKYLIEKKH